MSPVVIQNLNDISFIDYKKWNSNITLEWMITQIAENFEEYFNKYIDINTDEYNEDGNIEKVILTLFNIVGIKKYEDFNIKFELPDFTNKNESKYWNSGTGYGYAGTEEWDINSFIEQQNEKNGEIIYHLQTIIDMYHSCSNKQEVDNNMNKFISNQLNGSTILDINKKIELYIKYLDIIKELNLSIDYNIINNIYQEVKEIIDNEQLYNQLNEESGDGNNNLKHFCEKITDIYKSYEILEENVISISNDEKINYESLVKK